MRQRELAGKEWTGHFMGRIEGRIQSYSSQDMSQEELRSLVPSLQEEAA